MSATAPRPLEPSTIMSNRPSFARCSISRFHAYFRQRGDKWIVADAGSKNGSELEGTPLEPRKERELASGVNLRIGDLELTFYTAAELYGVLGGR